MHARFHDLRSAADGDPMNALADLRLSVSHVWHAGLAAKVVAYLAADPWRYSYSLVFSSELGSSPGL